MRGKERKRMEKKRKEKKGNKKRRRNQMRGVKDEERARKESGRCV